MPDASARDDAEPIRSQGDAFISEAARTTHPRQTPAFDLPCVETANTSHGVPNDNSEEPAAFADVLDQGGHMSRNNPSSLADRSPKRLANISTYWVT